MKKGVSGIFAFIIYMSIGACAQEIKENKTARKFPLTEDHWRIENMKGSLDTMNVTVYQGKNALLLEPGQKAYLKDRKFGNFEMEFYCNGYAPGVGFRLMDRKNYEFLYLRMMMSGKKDALQYLPVYNGSLPWQLYNYPRYEGQVMFPRTEVAVVPLTLKDELVPGKVSGALLTVLEKSGIDFSTESFIDIPEGSPSYIYDPKSSEALVFEVREENILFMDVRTWVHVKVEVINDHLSVYIEDMDTPAFVVDELKHDSFEGGIILYSDFGDVYFSDIVIREIEGPKAPAPDAHQSGISSDYLTRWQLSEPFLRDSVAYLSQVDSLLGYTNDFRKVMADSDGLLNISRFYGDMDKTVLLRTTLESDSAQEVTLNFDYADRLVILLNDVVLFEGEMNFRPPPEKGLEGRVFVEDEQIILDLTKGSNELIFVLSGDNRQKYNWGFIARLEHLQGISIK